MQQQAYENILDRAIQSEVEAAQFYSNVAAKTANSFLQELFLGFSREEQKHRRILEGFRSNPSAAIHFNPVSDFGVSETVPEPTLSLEMTPVNAIALAMKKEEAAMRGYTQLAEACQDSGQRTVFMELAAMERDHKSKMEAAFVDIGFPEVW
jgi:rubrerythrin